jgi:hypothetical protein
MALTFRQYLIMEKVALKRLLAFLKLWMNWRRDFREQAILDWESQIPANDNPCLYDLGCNVCSAKWTAFYPNGSEGGKAQCPDCKNFEGVIVRTSPEGGQRK